MTNLGVHLLITVGERVGLCYKIGSEGVKEHNRA